MNLNMALDIGNLGDLVRDLKCSKCDKLLSVFPIYMSSSIGNVCGRCTQSIEQMISDNSVARITAYESVAKYLIFPCSNKEFGCGARLKCDEVVNHENCCLYRRQMCPFNAKDWQSSLQCDWYGGVIDLNVHLNLSHASAKTEIPHIFTLKKYPLVQVNYVEIGLDVFIIITRYDGITKKFYTLVMCCTDATVCKNYEYQMKLGKGDDCYLTLSKSDTSVLLDTSEALKQVDNTIIIDGSIAKNMFGDLNSDLICKISITKKSPISNQAPTPPDTKENSTLNKFILEELECPVCTNYMKPHIYMCTQGHSLCYECKKKIVECPICRASSITIRNFTLEKLTLQVLYPCKYSFYGCKIISDVRAIQTHETICNYRTTCPLRIFPHPCNVKEDILDLISHIHQKHSELMGYPLHTHSLPFLRGVERTMRSYHGTIVNNEIFILCCENNTAGVLKFNMLHLGMKDNIPKYRYKCEFVDQSKLGLQFIMKRVCQAVPLSINDAFQNCLVVPWDLLEPLTLNDSLNYFSFIVEKI